MFFSALREKLHSELIPAQLADEDDELYSDELRPGDAKVGCLCWALLSIGIAIRLGARELNEVKSFPILALGA